MTSIEWLADAAQISADQADPKTPVMVKDKTSGKLYSIVGLTHEPRLDDGEGNYISTGDTFWLDIEEY